jgi:DNA-binding transcriptional LysR family regulator
MAAFESAGSTLMPPAIACFRERHPAVELSLALGDRLQLRLGLGEPREDRLGVADDGLAGFGQADAACAALHEHRSGLALQRGDLLGDGGLGEGQRLCRRREGPLDGDFAENPHPAYVEHQMSLYEMRQSVVALMGTMVQHR